MAVVKTQSVLHAGNNSVGRYEKKSADAAVDHCACTHDRDRGYVGATDKSEGGGGGVKFSKRLLSGRGEILRCRHERARNGIRRKFNARVRRSGGRRGVETVAGRPGRRAARFVRGWRGARADGQAH